MLTVRSSKAVQRRETAYINGLNTNCAHYALSGIDCGEITVYGNKFTLSADDRGSILFTGLNCPAIFFDQTHYTFSIQLPDDTAEAYIFSISPLWCDSADFDPAVKRLILPVNFGNDLGDFEICWEWINESGERSRASFSSQVFSSKLDIYLHFKIMFKEVEQRFNWLRLDLLRQTAWGWHCSPDSPVSLQTWLLIFQQVRADMQDRLVRIIKQHRRRLIDTTRYCRADRLRKMSAGLEEKVNEGIAENPGRCFADKRKILDPDSPENRYIKHIFLQTIMQLTDISDKLDPLEKVSDVFKSRLKEWTGEWTVLSRHRFWKGIGLYKGLRRGSQILIQDPLYAGIRRSWFLLQQGLEFLDNQLKGGIQNAAQLYEIWCLAKIIEIIEDKDNCKGWIAVADGKPVSPVSTVEDDFEIRDKSIGSIRFTFVHKNNTDAELSVLFQPSADNKPAGGNIWEGMTAVPVVQNPDIVLRLRRNDLPGKPVYTWIFDAKYRIEGTLAPDDTLNQMHRYRDAILWSSGSDENSRLIRESIGAFVLYPGDEDVIRDKKQINSVDRTNIGAYPLKPDIDETGTKSKVPQILSGKLKELLSIDSDFPGVKDRTEIYFASVPYVKQKRKEIFAKCITRHHDNMNTKDYWKKCRLYRLPVWAAEKQHLYPETWSYIIPVSPEGMTLGNFPVLSCERLKRHLIEEEYRKCQIPIYEKEECKQDDYWLFYLGDELQKMPDIKDLDPGEIVTAEETDAV